jgi:hypothetical protein
MHMQLSLFDLDDLASTSVVYFAERRGMIKIGQTCNLARRMRELRARPLLTLAGGVDLERTLHRRFAGSRMVGEWFAASPEVWNFIWSHMPKDRAA